MTTSRAPSTGRLRHRARRIATTFLASVLAVVGTAGTASAAGNLTVDGASSAELTTIEQAWDLIADTFVGRDDCLVDLQVNVVDRAEDYATSDHGSIRAFYRSPGIVYVEHSAVMNGRTVLHEMAHHVDTRCRFRYTDEADAFRVAQGLPTDTSWFAGSSWYMTPAEQFAETVLTVLGITPRMTITAEAKTIVTTWAVGSSAVPGTTVETPVEPEVVKTEEPFVLVDEHGRWYRFGESESAPSPFYYGNPGDYPFVGDWDCDGIDTPGLYRQSDGFVYLRNSNTAGIADWEFFFGNPGDVPVVGDFDGDGCDTVSIWRPAEARVYIINELGEDNGGLGAAEYDYPFGEPGDLPFVGDFDGDGIDTVGLYRPSAGYVFFANRARSTTADTAFTFGDPGDEIVAGDWDGDGIDTVGLYRPSDGNIYLRLENQAGAADITMSTLQNRLHAAG
ncbi:MAG TPA: hypothetical protein VLD62_09290 [Acidimicrobiia bacterium]|nr:hypothetical protein [Acidimicrobiia bacterium]